jgi:hypothetical protein
LNITCLFLLQPCQLDPNLNSWIIWSLQLNNYENAAGHVDFFVLWRLQSIETNIIIYSETRPFDCVRKIWRNRLWVHQAAQGNKYKTGQSSPGATCTDTFCDG